MVFIPNFSGTLFLCYFLVGFVSCGFSLFSFFIVVIQAFIFCLFAFPFFLSFNKRDEGWTLWFVLLLFYFTLRHCFELGVPLF